MWCIAEITPEYRERMYRLLDLYAEDYDADFPVVCIDPDYAIEKFRQSWVRISNA